MFNITKLYLSDFNLHTNDSSDRLLPQFLILVNSSDLQFSPSIHDQFHTSQRAEHRLQILSDLSTSPSFPEENKNKHKTPIFPLYYLK